MVPYSSMLDVPYELAEHVSWLIHARLRAPGERAFARLKTWRILRRARCSTNRISHTLLTCGYSG